MIGQGQFENGTFVAIRDEPRSSTFSKICWIIGLLSIALGILFFANFFDQSSKQFGQGSSIGDYIILSSLFILPGIILAITPLWNISWTDHSIQYRSIKGKKSTAQFNRITDWGPLNSIAGLWVEFDNAPTLYVTQFMTNYDFLEKMIGQKIKHSYTPIASNGNELSIKRELVIPAGVVIFALIFYVSAKLF